MVELDAYAVDCRVYGQIELGDGRLSDELDRTAELLITDARLEDLVDGHVVEMPEACDRARGGLRRGREWAARRPGASAAHAHTRVKVEVGPYRVEGAVHGTPASDPLGVVLRRVAWVPLTEATIMYRRGADDVTDEVETLLVNRHLMRSFRASKQPLDLPGRPPGAEGGGRAIDPTVASRDEARPKGELADPPSPSQPTE